MSRVPQRWFYGAAYGRLIHGLIDRRPGDLRDLSPGERYLGTFIVPRFQRGLVWTEQQKARLIESIYMGLPIGSIVWNQTTHSNPCDSWLLDGQQRMSAIVGYMEGEFSVRGLRFTELHKDEQSHFLRIGVPFIETNIAQEDQCRDIYDRLVYGGTSHEPVP